MTVGIGASAAATTTTVPPDTTLQVSLADRFVGCDPVGATVSPSTTQVLSLVLPEAYVSNVNGVVVQAQSFLEQAEVQSLKPLVVEYSVLPNADWVNGRAIGLSDFVATWRWGRQGTGSAATQYRLIRSITKGASPNQILVSFSQSTSDWRALFSPLIPATSEFQSFTSCASPTSAVDLSGGPYVIASSTQNTIVLIRNPRWWGLVPQFSSITLNAASTPGLAGFSGTDNVGLGESDWLPSPVLAGMTSSPGISSHVDFSNRILSLDFNTTRQGAVPILVREAVSHYLDRKSIVQATVGTLDTSIAPGGSHLLAQGQPNYVGPISTNPVASTTTTTIPTATSSMAIAARDLRRAGFRRRGMEWINRSGRQLSLSMLYPADDHWALQVSTLVRAQMADQGIDVKVSPASSSPDVAQMLRSNRTQLGLITRPTDPFPAHSAAWFTTSSIGPASPLWSGFQDKALNALATQASADMNPADALPLYQQIDADLWISLPSLPIFTEPSILVWSTSINGVTLNPYPPGTLASLLTWKVVVPTPQP